MKKLKPQLIVFIAFFALLSAAKAQEETNPFHLQILNESKEKAELIIEGESQESKSFKLQLSEGIDMITATKIVPKETLKGVFEAGKTIIVVIPGGFVDGLGYVPSLVVPQKGIYLLKQMENPVPGDPFFENAVIYAPSNGAFINYNNGFQRAIGAEAWYETVKFKCIKQAKTFIANGTMEECNNKATQSSSDYEDFLSRFEIRSQSLLSPNATTLIYDIVNVQTTGSTPQYLEFDVYVSASDNATYYDAGGVFMTYETGTFGPNVVANNKITCTRGSTIASSSDYDLFTVLDDGTNNNQFEVYILANTSGTPNRFNVTTTPQELFHVKLEISDCLPTPNIEFTPPPSMDAFSAYSTSSSGMDFNGYSGVTATDTYNSPACVMIISGYSPSPVRGGTGDIITITGAGFGATQGGGYVEMANADDGGATMVTLNTMDIQSWSDNLITIKVPSFVYDPLNTSNRAVPGSGAIVVHNSLGDMASTDPYFQIMYSVSNTLLLSPNAKVRTIRWSTAADSSLLFQMNTSVPALNSQSESCISKAMRDWTCNTGYPFVLGTAPYTSNNSFLQDNQSIISLGTVSNPAFVMETKNWEFTDACVNNTTSEVFVFCFETDIRINSSLTSIFTYDTSFTQNIPSGNFDFYSVILHELGHAHLLKHVNTVQSMLYYFVNTGLIAASSRQVYLWIDDINGGQHVSGISASPIVISVCTYPAAAVPIGLDSPSNCAGTSNDIEGYSNISGLTAYPNPTSADLTISFNLESQKDISIIAYDLMGKLVISDLYPSQIPGTNSYTVDLNNVAAGSYIVEIKVGNEHIYLRIVRN